MSRSTNQTFVFFQHAPYVLLAVLVLGVPGTRAAEAEETWTPLFNGKDFDGFAFHLGNAGADNAGTFTVSDGMIICTGKPAGYMYTKKRYSRYTLEYDWTFVRPAGLKDDRKFRSNSGCLVHIGEENALGVWPRSIEVQGAHSQAGLILPIPRNLKCKVTDDGKARARVLKPVGQWQTTRIEVDGGNMIISLNGTVVSTVRDCELTEGPIGFQSEGAEIHMKNIRIRVK
ncbi:MAG: 3-keto-disaccharide hydrolase [Isosphaeraceae bacterium]